MIWLNSIEWSITGPALIRVVRSMMGHMASSRILRLFILWAYHLIIIHSLIEIDTIAIHKHTNVTCRVAKGQGKSGSQPDPKTLGLSPVLAWLSSILYKSKRQNAQSKPRRLIYSQSARVLTQELQWNNLFIILPIFYTGTCIEQLNQKW